MGKQKPTVYWSNISEGWADTGHSCRWLWLAKLHVRWLNFRDKLKGK